MEELQGSVGSNPFLFSVIFLSFLLLVYRIFTRGGKLNLPPSPPRLPVIGNVHQLGKLPHRSLRALAEKYGPVMLLHFGGNPTVVVSSAELAREAMKTHDVILADRPRTTASKILLYGSQDIVFVPRQARKICVLELLSLKRVQSFQFVREEEAADAMEKIRRACLSGCPVNLSEILLGVSYNIASRCVMGRKVEEDDGRSNYAELTRKFPQQLTEFSFGNMFRSLEWLDHVTGLIPRLKATAMALDALLDQVIEEHRNSGTVADQFAKKDFIDILLHVQKSGKLDLPLTEANIKSILLNMFVGGTDTISTVMEWLMAELVRNPAIMAKAQEEVRRIVGKKPMVEKDDIDKMNYLKCVINEALRLHPPLPLLAPREASASLELGNYHIPAKTTFLINVFAIHRDPKLWDRPEEFIPERFENNKIDFQGQDFQFLPFGSGRRICPGIGFGMASVSFIAANLLHQFDWKLPDDIAPEDLDMSEDSGVNAAMKTPLRLVPSLYSC